MIEWFYLSMFVFIFRLLLFLCFHYIHFQWNYNQNDVYSNWLINCLEQFFLLAIIFCGLKLVNAAEKLLVLLRDGRKLLGILRSFDQFGMNFATLIL